MSTTASAFFYGTLMHPTILKQIIQNEATHLVYCPAILLNYTRHKVKDVDYPGIIPESKGKTLFSRELSQDERSVRGTLVMGLTESDIEFLDYFEGDEYKRVEVDIHPLAPSASISTHSEEDLDLVLLHSTPLPPTPELASPFKAQTYVFLNVAQLEPELWSFEDFVKENAYKWFDYESD
ncbi:hypothetical protein FA15DRAFT_673599 [Coprinopsis marcescibilis]|uniref:Putative gamma-glutamylcyclotransferase n=1 Tax=Coprinopsis marcescibilis TaxID=230819 RepID=A0A5C3KJ34_COPMA|nr:hypothetical protein FA15DRAFT_673599 [Coprinopsis marcescibilis]